MQVVTAYKSLQCPAVPPVRLGSSFQSSARHTLDIDHLSWQPLMTYGTSRQVGSQRGKYFWCYHLVYGTFEPRRLSCQLERWDVYHHTNLANYSDHESFYSGPVCCSDSTIMQVRTKINTSKWKLPNPPGITSIESLGEKSGSLHHIFRHS